ncbi:putative membrane protein, partial [Vibrio harveyi]
MPHLSQSLVLLSWFIYAFC